MKRGIEETREGERNYVKGKRKQKNAKHGKQKQNAADMVCAQMDKNSCNGYGDTHTLTAPPTLTTDLQQQREAPRMQCPSGP